MPLIKIKLFQNDNLTNLAADIAAYKAGAGAELLTSQRGMDAAEFVEPDGDRGVLLALAHGGLAVPVSKIGNLAHDTLLAKGGLADVQAAVDAALAAVVHKTVTDGDANAVAGSLTSATMAFEAEDVGRKLVIGTETRTITAFTSATEVVYSGAAITGTGLTVKLLGAEVLQDLHISASKSRDGKFNVLVAMATGGQVA